MSVWEWSLTEGMRRNGGAPEAGSASPRAVLDFISAYPHPAIFHLKDFHEPLRESAEIRRRLRDIYAECLDQRKFVVISSPVHYIPEEIERSVLFLDLRTPDVIELAEFLREEEQRLFPDGQGAGEELRNQLARASWASPRTKPATPYAARWPRAGSWGRNRIPALLEEKRLLVNRTGVIEFISEPASLGDVGGLEGLKRWLIERRKLFEMRDSLSAEIVPKGILMMGIPGCGKSLCVKAIAANFQLPLYRVDMVEIFSGRHGKPEGAFVAACKMMEDMAPAVLWFDEIEMGHHFRRLGRGAGAHFCFLPHLDAGEDPRAVRGRHRQPHRPSARRDDPQGALRRSVFRGPAD